MKLDDSERVYHRTYISDKNANPILGKISGNLEISLFIASIVLAVLGYYVLTKPLGFGALPSLAIGLLPMGTYAVLTRFVAGKPRDYIPAWIESRRLEKRGLPLLTANQPTNENQ